MTIEKAIKMIQNDMKLHHDNLSGTYRQALNMAIEALEKQIPKKAIGEHYAHMRCPSCNHRIPSGMGSSSRRRDNWCNYCGQAIDWGEKNDHRKCNQNH